MADIFIAYAHEDHHRTEDIARALGTIGWTVWWDTMILGGKKWDAVITHELAQAKCALVLWSKASVESDYVKEEAHDAARRGNLVPVLIDNVRIPYGFGLIQYTDFVGWSGSALDPAFEKLRQAVLNIAGPPQAVSNPDPTYEQLKRHYLNLGLSEEDANMHAQHEYMHSQTRTLRYFTSLIFPGKGK